jgi:hypothetical protein
VVDDRGEEGTAALAAVRALRARGAARVIVAVPVCTSEWAATVGREADEISCDTRTRDKLDLNRLCERFSPVPDVEVLALLDVAACTQAPPPGQMPAPEPMTPVELPITHELHIDVGDATLAADLTLPKSPTGLVLFVDGDGASRASLRNRKLAVPLNEAGFATLLVDLLTEPERTHTPFPERELPLITRRLEEITRWAPAERETAALPIG